MKQVSIFFLTIIFVALLTAGCGNNTASTDTHKDSTANFDVTAMRKIIDEKNNQFTKAHITHDSAVMINIYTQDAKVFAPNSDVVIGRPAIAEMVSEYMKFDIKEFREETTALYGNEDYLINEGTYFMSYGKDNISEKGKFINIWKKVDGDWKLFFQYVEYQYASNSCKINI